MLHEQVVSGHLLSSRCRRCAAEERFCSYGLTKALCGDFDQYSPIFVCRITAQGPVTGQFLFKIGVCSAERNIEVRCDMRISGFDLPDTDRKLNQSMRTAIIIEQVNHHQLLHSQYIFSAKIRDFQALRSYLPRRLFSYYALADPVRRQKLAEQIHQSPPHHS